MSYVLEKSKISFLNYQILELNLVQDIFKKDDRSVDLSVSIDEYNVDYEESNEGYLAKGFLRIVFLGKNTDGETKIQGHSKIMGVFWGQKTDFTLEEYKNFTHSLIMPRLLGIFRSVFLNVSSQSGTGSLMIPLVDMSILNYGKQISYQDMLNNHMPDSLRKKFLFNKKMIEVFEVVLSQLETLILEYNRTGKCNGYKLITPYHHLISESDENEGFFNEMIDYFLIKTGCKKGNWEN